MVKFCNRKFLKIGIEKFFIFILICINVLDIMDSIVFMCFKDRWSFYPCLFADHGEYQEVFTHTYIDPTNLIKLVILILQM